MTKPGAAFPMILSRRLRLRRIEPRDAIGLHACFGDPEAMRFWDFPLCRTVAETERMLPWLAKTASPYDHLAWAIADKAGDRCIGMVSYHHREARHKRLELGYIVAPRHQRQGFGSEAVRAVLGYCINGLGAHRVQALVHPENSASISLVERLGFRCEGGPLTDYWRVGNGYRSAMLYAYVASADESGAEPIAKSERAADRAARKQRARQTRRLVR
jgi:[ribosomal protein S5]-alanine N-acetyltransferase